MTCRHCQVELRDLGPGATPRYVRLEDGNASCVFSPTASHEPAPES